MAYFPTQEDIDLLFQKEKTYYSKVEILDKNFKVLNSIEGNLISDSYSIDSTSNIRRTYQMELQVSDHTFSVGKGNYIWFDRYIRPYVGIYSSRKRKTIWYLMGTYIYREGSYSYNEATFSLSLICNDMMCLLTGDIDGIAQGLDWTLPEGTNIKEAIISTIQLFGITKFKIDILDKSIIQKLEFPSGTAAYSILEKVMEYLPNYEYFFDLDGTFIVQKMPCYINEADIMNDDIFDQLVISDNYSFNFQGKNCVELWGKTFNKDNISRSSEDCTYVNNTYNVLFKNFEEFEDYMTISIKIPKDNLSGCKVNLNNLGTFVVLDDYERPLKANTLKADTSYMFLYRNGNFYFLGDWQVHAICKNENDASPLSINNVGKELWAIKTSGEYENILSGLLAKERAMYECYYVSNLNDTVSLELCSIPWLDVNLKVSYTIRTKNLDQKKYRWIITSISGGTLNGTINVTMTKYYPEWSEIFNQDFM